MNGFFGKVLSTDLSSGTHRVEQIPDAVYRTYLGGRGLAAYLLMTKNPPGVDFLSPANHLVFALGPASDQRVWGSSRYGVFSKSPQTGFFGESYSGGRVAEHMSRAGYDAVTISGRAAGPVTLHISDAGIEIKDAAVLWGQDTYASQDALTAGHDGPCAVLVIGPAGERRIPFAVIENDYCRSAGRTGMGAIMGAKNLKGLLFSWQTPGPGQFPQAVGHPKRRASGHQGLQGKRHPDFGGLDQ